MKIEMHLRVKGGWSSRTINATPEEVKELKAKAKALREERSMPNGCGCYPGVLATKTCDFCMVKVGEEIAGRASGTLTELYQAGLELRTDPSI